MIIKRADGASSAQIVTVFISRALVDILTEGSGAHLLC